MVAGFSGIGRTLGGVWGAGGFSGIKTLNYN